MSYRAYTPPSHSHSQPYYDQRGDVSPVQESHPGFPPPPPAHRSPVGAHPDSNHQNNYSNYSPPGVTPGADNLGEAAAGGGINGIALGVAGSHERESGVRAMRDMPAYDGPRRRGSPSQERTPFSDHYAYESPTPPRPTHSQPWNSSNPALVAGGAGAAGVWSSNSSQHSMPISTAHSNPYPYSDNPYNRYSSSNLNLASQMGEINPNDVADDDDWGMGPGHQKRRSFVAFGAGSGSRDGTPGLAAGAAAGAAAGGLAAGASTRDASGQYNAVPHADTNQPELVREKAEYLKSSTAARKRRMWIAIIVIAIIVIGGIVGGVLGSLLNKGKGSGDGKDGKGSESAQSVAEDNKNDLTADSDEIKKLMNNKDLKKVFPGMDYTPLNGQFPECLDVPPSQNNITRDVAVMSQLTNAVRLYGTDCNQTEMVLHSIKALNLQKSMKVWLGVWLGTNKTTNDRQVSQMWDVFDNLDKLVDKDTKATDIFKGVIVGNEVLFRKDLTSTQLINNITDIKGKLGKRGIDLPVATSDLGDNWTADMAKQVDIVMSNVHPFFAGVEVSKAAGWTWDFWTGHDVVLTKGNSDIKQIIAEVGWPSGGGNDCGENDCKTDTDGSIAGVDEMNQFMEDWICPSMENKTEYFWFSAFDEPWKIRFNEKGKEWEDKWGLMDVNRNLKKGVTIPDCGGKTVS